MKNTILVSWLALGAAACGPADATLSSTPPPDQTIDDLKGTVGAGRACSATKPCMRGLSCEASPSGQDLCQPPLSLQLSSQGGPVNPAMQVWTVVWQGDEATGQALDAFNGRVLSSAYWSQVTAEYGIGQGTAMGVIALGAAPSTLSGADVEAALATLPGTTALDGTVVSPPNDATVFTFLVPKGTSEPGGYYHSETARRLTSVSGELMHVPYIVMPQDSVGYMTDWDYLTYSQTHELAETATDPHCNTQIAWYTFQEEVADLCNDIPVWMPMPDGSRSAVSRIWSVSRAATNQGDACVPALATPYANVVSRPAQIVVPETGSQSTQVTLVPFSYGTAATVHWHVFVNGSFRASPAQGDATPGSVVSFTLTRTGSAARSALNVWMTDPSAPNANIPLGESFGFVVP